MVAPVGRADLVFDQRIDGLVVRHPQQRLGQCHQRQTLVGGKSVFAEKTLGQCRTGSASNLAHDLDRPILNPLARLLVRTVIRNQIIQDLGFVGAMMRANFFPIINQSVHHSRTS